MCWKWKLEIKLTSPNTNISLLSILVSAQLFDNINCLGCIKYIAKCIPKVIIKVICGWHYHWMTVNAQYLAITFFNWLITILWKS